MKQNYFIFTAPQNFQSILCTLCFFILFGAGVSNAQNFTADEAADWDVFPVGNLRVSDVSDAAAEDGSAIGFTTEVSTENWYDVLAQTFQNRTPSVIKGNEYTVSFDHRADAPRQIRVKVLGRPTDTYGPEDNTYYNEFVKVVSGYQNFSFTFISNDAVPGSVHVQLFAGGDDTVFYVNNFEITGREPGPEQGEEPFEDNAKWNTYREGDLNQEIVADPDAVNGEAFRISPQTSVADKEWYDTGFQILQDAAVREDAGKTYAISFRYRSTAERQFRLSLLSRPLNTFGDSDTPYYGEFLQAGTDYQDFNIRVTSPATTPSAIYIGFLVGGNDSPLFIDNIQIEEVVPTRDSGTFYVSKDGNDSNTGTENNPEGAWQTITYALSQLIAGDVLLLNDGLYQENNLELNGIQGGPDTKTVVKSINKWGAKIEGTTQYETIFAVENSSYIEIDGIEVFNNNNIDFEDWNAGVQIARSNHVTVKNVFAHDCGCNGISGREGDYFIFENNIVRDNAKTNPYNCSGISVYQAINLDDEPGFHIIIRNNVAFENECRLPFTPLGFDVPTDGNGIILDDFNQTQSEGVVPYTAATLVENNLTFNNGGAGIKIFEVGNATVRNNTAWHNNYVLQEFSSGIGEIGLQQVTGEMTVSNNIAVKTFQQTGYGLFLQPSEGGSATFTNNMVVGSNSFEGNQPVLMDNTFVSDNQQSYPKFANATTDVAFDDIQDFIAYFGLREGSPALDAANPDLASDEDLNGTPRPVGAEADIGAYEGIQEGTGPLNPDATLVANSMSTITAISIDGIRDGAYIGTNYDITKKLGGEAITDEQDLSARWTSLWDDEYLYVYVDVKDDDLRNDSESSENDDSVEVYLDGDNSRDTLFGANDFIFSIGRDEDNILSEVTKNDVTGVNAAVLDTDEGYSVEIAIPWSKLVSTPLDSLRIGLDVHINEDDNGGDRDTKLVWQDVLEDFSTNPSRFGEVVLLDTPLQPAIEKIADSLKIDGSQDATWQALPAIQIANTFDGEAVDSTNLSANWKSVWDDENLYFFISVTDDDLRNDSDQWYEDDGVEIYIDADNSKNSTYGANDYQITIGWNNADLVEDTKNNLGEGSVAKVIDTPTGYDVEVSIPWTALAVEPANGNFLGLDVHVNDDDGGGSRSGKVAWFATADESFRNPSTFGNVFLVDDGQMPPIDGVNFGEVGNSTATDEWTKVDYANVYKDAIVVIGPIGTGGGQPATVAVRNVGGTRFQWRVDEWEYLDGVHNAEKAGYMVVERGAYELQNGTKLVADKTRVTGSWKTVSFPFEFAATPIVMPQIINLKAGRALDVRLRNVTPEGFEMLVQGEEGIQTDPNSIKELVAYVAIETGTGEDSGASSFEVAKSTTSVTNRNTILRFAQNYTDADRILLGHEQTTNGLDPGTIRYRSGSLTVNGATLFFQEEKSRDNETAHVPEKFGYAIFESSGSLVGNALTEKENQNPGTVSEAKTFEIKLYPNPAQNNIVLNVSEVTGTKNTEINIYNLYGQKVLQKINSKFGDALDISRLTSGMYIVQVELEGKTIRKIMVKK